MIVRTGLVLFAFLIVFAALPSHAQFNNKPFAFKGTPDGGVGMSIGGQQAIINKKILGVTPKNLVRSPSTGELLTLERGPDHIAIVSAPGGSVIPTFKGSSWKGDNYDLSAGVFNAYFAPSNGGISASSYATLHSAGLVSTWTGRVSSGDMPVSYRPDNPVDVWTGMVYY